jgi:fructokinase
LIDLIGDREQTDKYTSVVGGANANVALALGSARQPHKSFLGRLSFDGFGTQIKHRLASNGVDLSWSIDARSKPPWRLQPLTLQGVASYSFYVNGTADWGWTREELPSVEKLLEASVQAVQFGCLAMAIGPGNLVLESLVVGACSKVSPTSRSRTISTFVQHSALSAMSS